MDSSIATPFSMAMDLVERDANMRVRKPYSMAYELKLQPTAYMYK